MGGGPDLCGRWTTALGALTAALIAIAVPFGGAAAQGYPGASGTGQGSPTCMRLESQLAALDRGQNDSRAEQIRRYEEAAGRQQQELDRLVAQQRRMGCSGGGFFLFGGGQSAQCDQINDQVQRMRSNLERMLSGLRQLQAGGHGQEEQRRAILVALTQNNCGPQYRTAARPRGFFETLFGGPAEEGPGPGAAGTEPWGDPNQSSSFRTVCVRTCDGSFFPISFSTNQSRFATDERICQRMCPAAEVQLYTHRNPGEDIGQAVSLSGRPYRDLPTAFRFRQEFNPSCTCKAAGQSWTEAVGDDPTLERGDVVVTEERARALSAPRPAQPQQQQQQQPKQQPRQKQSQAPRQKPPPPPPAAEPQPPPPPPPANATPPRAVGPQFYR